MRQSSADDKCDEGHADPADHQPRQARQDRLDLVQSGGDGLHRLIAHSNALLNLGNPVAQRAKGNVGHRHLPHRRVMDTKQDEQADGCEEDDSDEPPDVPPNPPEPPLNFV